MGVHVGERDIGPRTRGGCWRYAYLSLSKSVVSWAPNEHSTRYILDLAKFSWKKNL